MWRRWSGNVKWNEQYMGTHVWREITSLQISLWTFVLRRSSCTSGMTPKSATRPWKDQWRFLLQERNRVVHRVTQVSLPPPPPPVSPAPVACTLTEQVTNQDGAFFSLWIILNMAVHCILLNLNLNLCCSQPVRSVQWELSRSLTLSTNGGTRCLTTWRRLSSRRIWLTLIRAQVGPIFREVN